MVRCKLNLGVLLWVLSSAVALYAVDSDGYYIYKPDWSGGRGSWSDGSRWYDGVAPSENCKVKIGNEATADVYDDDMDLVVTLSEIRLHTTNAVIRFNITRDYRLPFSVYHYGKIVKNGSGSLYLDNNRSTKAYETTCGIVINEGALYLPKLAAVNNNDFFVGPLFVNAPGRLYLYDGCPTSAAGIAGDGAVSNLSEVANSETHRRLKITGGNSSSPYEFSGTLGNNISYMNMGGHQYFRRDNDTSSRTVRIYSGTLGLSAMARGEGDSISKGETFNIRGTGNAAMRLKYIGDGVCSLTHKILMFNDAKNFILDSGDDGAIEIKGAFHASSQANTMTRLTLDGESAKASSFLVPIQESGTNATYLIKKGSGVWRLAADDNQLDGVIEVQKGTLEFTSLAERGILCALGRQNILHENYFGPNDNDRVAPYAIRLGDGSSEVAENTGTLAYVGTVPATCSTRPIAVSGAGRLSGNGSSALEWEGIKPLDADATIVLSGTASGCVARNVCDKDESAISVVKEGAGGWNVDGNMKITGSVECRGGSLRVLNSKKYKFYRFNIRDTWKNVADEYGVTGTDNAVLLRGFALISSDNPSSNVMYKAVYNPSANGKAYMLKPGEVCYANGANVHVRDDRYLDKLFVHSVFQAQASSSNLDIDPGDSNTWVQIAMRVPEDAGEIVKYDICTGTNGSATEDATTKTVPFCREVRSWSIDGSSDGVTWECIVSEDRTVATMTPLSNSRWYSSNKTDSMKGMELSSTEYQALSKTVSPSAVGVSGGGALSFEEMVETAALKLYANESGTISNVRFLSGGTIDVSGAGDVRGRLPVVFEDVVGLDNVVSYALTVNGERTFSKIALHGGTLSIVPPGLSVHIR